MNPTQQTNETIAERLELAETIERRAARTITPKEHDQRLADYFAEKAAKARKAGRL